ncbi:TRAM domain-containing protein [bacterium]|nr:MAG: TRAM domain-containing protein [bacterium]
MAERTSERRHPLAGWRAKTAWQAAVVLLFAVIGAGIFATGGPPVLELLYDHIARSLDQRGTEKFGPTPFMQTALGLLGIVVGAFIGGRFLRGLEKLGLRWEQLEIGDKVTLFVGIFSGLIASVPLLQVFQYFDISGPYRLLLIGGVTLGLSSLCVYTLQTMADILPWNRTRTKGRRTGIKVLDTNVIIDGRVYDVVKAGFLEGQLYVPRFVLEELQYIADSHDSLRRQRGRRGLDVLRHMQAEFDLDVGTYDRLAGEPGEEVDARLVRLAKSIGADIVTNDFNLNRVAGLQDVRVLSLNDLALATRTNILPEETLAIKVIREGNQFGQGVGYLEDGTMVVVEGGAPFVGETADVIVTQVIQTERGKMVFAEASGEESREPKRRSGGRRTQA